MSFTCSKCGQDVKDENGVLIRGKFYGPDCASRILGIASVPFWYKGGDFEVASDRHQASQNELQREYEARKKSMSENWGFIKSLSSAFQRARSMDNGFEINFLADMATRHGIQFAKETAYQFEDFDSWDKAGKYQSDKFTACHLSEKQSAILKRLL